LAKFMYRFQTLLGNYTGDGYPITKSNFTKLCNEVDDHLEQYGYTRTSVANKEGIPSTGGLNATHYMTDIRSRNSTIQAGDAPTDVKFLAQSIQDQAGGFAQKIDETTDSPTVSKLTGYVGEYHVLISKLHPTMDVNVIKQVSMGTDEIAKRAAVDGVADGGDY